jgi:hypothetical protein
MRKIRVGAATATVLATFALVAGAQAAVTSSSITTPADGTLLLSNQVSDPSETGTVTVSGTTSGTSGDNIDIDCYANGSPGPAYAGTSGTGIPVATDGSFSVALPLSQFAGYDCELLAVPHGSAPAETSSYTGPRVGFSNFQTYTATSGGVDDYYFDDATLQANAGSDAIEDCGPFPYLAGTTTVLDTSPEVFDCAGSFYSSTADRINHTADLTSSDLQVDGQNAYGSYGAAELFTSASSLPGYPTLAATLDSFNSANGDAQTTESEPLVKCTPTNTYTPSSTDCTAFASTGVTLHRVTQYTDSAQVVTVTDTFSSTDGAAHALKLEYDTDFYDSAAGWELLGQSSFSYPAGETQAGPSSPGTLYAIDDTTAAPSFANPVGAATFSTPYTELTFDDTIWTPAYPTTLFEFLPTVPAGGSTSITWSYATATSLPRVRDLLQAPKVTITSPSSGAALTSSPVTVSGSAVAGGGVASVTVNGVAATVSGSSWSASVPLTPGANTLKATLTSLGGNTATASTTVSYMPATSTQTQTTPSTTAARVSVKSKSFNGKAVLARLACAAAGSNCSGTVTLRYTETVVKRHKKHRTTVTIASQHYAIGTGKTGTVTATLNTMGTRLLKARGRLAAKGIVSIAQAHGTKTGATFALTLKQPKRKKK